jgi:hypothetical protein
MKTSTPAAAPVPRATAGLGPAHPALLRRGLILCAWVALALGIGGCAAGGGAPTCVPSGGVSFVHGTVGPKGGSLCTADLNLTLTIPPGALSAPTEVAATQAVVVLGPAGLRYDSHVWRISAAGAAFARPATLTLRYRAPNRGGLTPAGLGLYQLQPRGVTWRVLGGSTRPNETVVNRITAPGTYAVLSAG